MDDQAYLEPGFDPASLTMPRLRNILVMHNVQYQSSAKKQQLVDLFNEQVLPQARKISAANARVKRTSRGIEDVAASQSSYDYDDEEEEAPPPPARTPSGRTGRRTTRARTEEAEEVVPVLRSARHSTAPPESSPRRGSSRHGRAPEPIREEPEPRRPQSSRKTRPAATTPIVKAEPDDDGSPFSSDNVFQTGSSPPAIRSSDAARRRTTLGPARSTDSRKQEIRRQTEDFRPIRSQNASAIPSRRTFEMPLAVIKKEEVEPSEEFTPEEQLDLVQAQQTGDLVPARRQTQRPSAVAKQGISVVSFVVLLILAAVWRQEKLEVGYCGVGRPSLDIGGVEIPEWAEPIRPHCEPCPPHAFCGEKLLTECESGFVLANHPLSLNGLIPLPPTCEPDSARARKVNAVKERAVEELREQSAKYECGEAPSAEIKETELKRAIATKRRKGMTNEEFEDLWSSAIGEIVRVEEVVSGSDGSGHPTLRSTSLARIPLGCAIRRSLLQTLRQYLWQLVGVLLVLSSGAYGRHRITSGRATEARAKQLAGLALEKLSIQASLHAQDPDVFPERYMSMAQLRDDVLRDEFSAVRRKTLWDKVQRKVEANSNVRPMVRESRTGDVGRVWEWVGAVRMIESPAAAGDRRKSGRVSFADSDRYIESADNSSSALQKRDVGEVSKWEEQRSYY